jgi:hypothetical protein
MALNFYVVSHMPSEPSLMEVDEKLYYFEGVIESPFSGAAQNKCDKYQN